MTYNAGVRYFTVHACPIKKRSCGLHRVMKPQRSRKDFRFLAPTLEEAHQWVSKFADLHCFINCLPHPMMLSKKQPDIVESEPLNDQPCVKSKSTPKILVILNPRSGHGRSSKVFHEKIEPIFQVRRSLNIHV